MRPANTATSTPGGDMMKKEYDFSKAVKNPYRRQKQQVTINLETKTVEYFKALSQRKGIPYQTLINLYLADCVENRREPHTTWPEQPAAT